MRKSDLISSFLRECFLAKRKFPSGVACTYIQLEHGLGVKCYPEGIYNRNYSFRKQKYLHSQRLAPRVYFKFNIYYPFDDIVIACYVTQHADPCSYADFVKIRNGVELKKKLLKLRIEVTDVKSKNCGFIRDRLVLIDCDYNSI